jgi:phospholipase C
VCEAMKMKRSGPLLLVLLVLSPVLSFALQTTHLRRTRSFQEAIAQKLQGRGKISKYSTPIRTVVVLMFENRSFDHMLGRLNMKLPEVEGYGPTADSTYFNHRNVSDPHSEKIFVHHKYMDRGWCDYDHSIPGTTFGIFGKIEQGIKAVMNGFVQHNDKICADPSMDKGRYATQGENVMGYFEPTDLPILYTLAQNFAVFDSYHASVPGPTHVNRFYAHSGTSHGEGEYNPTSIRMIKGWPQKTIYPVLRKAGYNWRNYFALMPEAIFLDELRHLENIHHFSYMEEFFEAARKGELPNYVFLEPAYFGTKEKGLPAQDQHPDHSLRAGEALLKEVYEALRASPQWNEILFLVTYDEHGGFYDHVPPIENIPSPDGIASPDVSPPFKFTRAGVRVPMIAISPWIDKQVVHAPPDSAKPAKNSLYEHTSIAATLAKLFPRVGDSIMLTDRIKWAATFEHLISRTSPRTDCPTKLPEVPAQTATELEAEWNLELSHLQLDMIALAHFLTGDAKLLEAKLKGEASALLPKVMNSFFTSIWAKAKKELGEIVDKAKRGLHSAKKKVGDKLEKIGHKVEGGLNYVEKKLEGAFK